MDNGVIQLVQPARLVVHWLSPWHATMLKINNVEVLRAFGYLTFRVRMIPFGALGGCTFWNRAPIPRKPVPTPIAPTHRRTDPLQRKRTTLFIIIAQAPPTRPSRYLIADIELVLTYVSSLCGNARAQCRPLLQTERS